MAETARTGVAIVGLGGAVATTAIAGVEMMRLGSIGPAGLPLADTEGLVPYTSLVFAGWDVDGDDLAKAAEGHGVLDHRQIEAAGPALAGIEPWPAVADPEYCRNARGTNLVAVSALRDRVAHIVEDLRRFRREHDLESLTVVNLASTERWPDLTLPALATADGFEKALDVDDAAITPGMLYAYAAITEGCPYVNFTPSASADVPALLELAEHRQLAQPADVHSSSICARPSSVAGSSA